MNGILNLHKPVGPTSFDMVRRVKQLTGVKRVGHGGTLDPRASGVLPVLLGQATRVSDFLLSASKAYRAVVLLGIATDTYDSEGKIVSEADPSGVTREQAIAALDRFRGLIPQTPPMYSALKHRGKRLYQLARAGVEVERKPRSVHVYDIQLTEWAPPRLTIEVECGRGTYIRSLAHDLGIKLGCGAHLEALTRLRVGPFSLAQALTTEELLDAVHGEYLPERIYAMDWVMLHLPALILSAEEEQAVRFGQALSYDGDASEAQGSGPVRAYGQAGDLIGLLQLDQDHGGWQPAKVFPATEA